MHFILTEDNQKMYIFCLNFGQYLLCFLKLKRLNVSVQNVLLMLAFFLNAC